MENLYWQNGFFGQIIDNKLKTTIENVKDISNLVMVFEDKNKNELFEVELNDLKNNRVNSVTLNKNNITGNFKIFRENNSLNILYSLYGLPKHSSGSVVFYLNEMDQPEVLEKKVEPVKLVEPVESTSVVKSFKPVDKLELEKSINIFYNDKDLALKQFGKIETWDISHITDMSYLFSEYNKFNENISEWDTSNVTDMSYMFYNSTHFNKDINSWNVSKVKNMCNLFGFAERFNNPLNKWDVSQVTNMEAMFNNARRFNQNINDWNVSQVTTMQYMFYNAKNFNYPIDKWSVSRVNNMKAMFYSAKSFNQSLIMLQGLFI